MCYNICIKYNATHCSLFLKSKSQNLQNNKFQCGWATSKYQYFLLKLFCHVFSLNATKLGVQTVKKEEIIFFICLWTTLMSAIQDIQIQHTLLGFVTKTTSFIRSSRAWSSVYWSQLPVLPDSNSQQKAHHITLLFPIQLLYVFVRTHVVRLPTEHSSSVIHLIKCLHYSSIQKIDK